MGEKPLVHRNRGDSISINPVEKNDTLSDSYDDANHKNNKKGECIYPKEKKIMRICIRIGKRVQIPLKTIRDRFPQMVEDILEKLFNFLEGEVQLG